MSDKTNKRKKKSKKATPKRRAKKAPENQLPFKLPTKTEWQERAKKLRAMLDEWMKDESGYDEETFPKLKEALERERDRLSSRRLFDD